MPRGAYPWPAGGYAYDVPATSSPDGKHHLTLTIVRKEPDLHRLARILLDEAEQQLRAEGKLRSDEDLKPKA